MPDPTVQPRQSHTRDDGECDTQRRKRPQLDPERVTHPREQCGSTVRPEPRRSPAQGKGRGISESTQDHITNRDVLGKRQKSAVGRSWQSSRRRLRSKASPPLPDGTRPGRGAPPWERTATGDVSQQHNHHSDAKRLCRCPVRAVPRPDSLAPSSRAPRLGALGRERRPMRSCTWLAVPHPCRAMSSRPGERVARVAYAAGSAHPAAYHPG